VRAIAIGNEVTCGAPASGGITCWGTDRGPLGRYPTLVEQQPALGQPGEEEQREWEWDRVFVVKRGESHDHEQQHRRGGEEMKDSQQRDQSRPLERNLSRRDTQHGALRNRRTATSARQGT